MVKKFIAVLVTVMVILPVNALAEKILFVTTDNPPYMIVENGKVEGLDTEIIQEVCKKIGIEPQFKAVPWKRALAMVEEGTAGAMYALFRTEERNKFLYFASDPIDTVNTVIIARKGSNEKITGLDDLKGKPLGVIGGFSYGPKFDNYSGLNKVPCNDQEELLKILNHGRINLCVAPELPFFYTCKRMNLQDKFEVAYIISEDSNYVGFSKKALGDKGKEIAEKFTKALKELNEQGVVQKLTEKYR